MSGRRVTARLLPRRRQIVPGDLIAVGRYDARHDVPVLSSLESSHLVFWASAGEYALVISRTMMTHGTTRRGPVRRKAYLVFINEKFGWLDIEYARTIVSGCGDAR